ncbi:hypothetical protein V3481_009901 [Fusarium oxysporum f. sp. vasinfectum]
MDPLMVEETGREAPSNYSVPSIVALTQRQTDYKLPAAPLSSYLLSYFPSSLPLSFPISLTVHPPLTSQSSLHSICSSIDIKPTILPSLIFTSTCFIPVILPLKSSLSTPPSSPVHQAPAFSGSPSTKRTASLDN